MSFQIKNNNEALGVILRGLDVAQSKGAFTLSEAAVLAQARSFFISEEDTKEIEPSTKPGDEKKSPPKKKSENTKKE
tara:strand:- start:184 stop:414 length:231 start_codon:yes stop_codon:yes gene_type:complete